MRRKIEEARSTLEMSIIQNEYEQSIKQDKQVDGGTVGCRGMGMLLGREEVRP